MKKPTLAVSPETVRQITKAYAEDSALIEAALRCLEARFGTSRGNALSSPRSVRDYLRLLLAPMQHEVFVGNRPVGSFVARKLIVTRVLTVASPSYIKTHGASN